MTAKERDPQLSEISNKLDVLIRLNALGIMKDMKTRKEQIALLSDANIGPKSIAAILGTTENMVNVTLHGIRKERGSRQAKEQTSSQTTDESSKPSGEPSPSHPEGT